LTKASDVSLASTPVLTPIVCLLVVLSNDIKTGITQYYTQECSRVEINQCCFRLRT